MFTKLFDFVNDAILLNINSMVGVFINIITPLLGACVGLYVVFLAYKSLFDSQNLMIMESIKFLVSLSLVTSIALSSTWYLDNFVPIVLGIGDDIAVNLLGGGTGVNSLQAMFDKIFADLNSMYTGFNLSWNIGESLAGAILTLLMMLLIICGAIPFLAVATTYLLVAKMMVSFLLILGPLFIMMSFFPSTRSFFQAWTGQCFNYILLSLVYPIAFSLFSSVLAETIFTNKINLSGALMTIIVFTALLLISVQIPVFTSSLSGGIGINGLVGNIGSSLRGIGSAAKGMKALKDGAGTLKNKIANIGKSNISAG
jgi:type IV secretion system protein VirB6